MIKISNFIPKKNGNPDTPLYSGALGTPVYSNLHIPSGQYQKIDGTVVNYDEVIVDTVLFNVNQTKNIVKTNIIGSEGGTVKEYIGMGDFVISCSLIFSSGQINVHPWEFEKKMNDVFKAPVALPIINTWLNNMGIFNIVITDFDMPQLPGEYSQSNISFNALSDTPFIIDFNPNSPVT